MVILGHSCGVVEVGDQIVVRYLLQFIYKDNWFCYFVYGYL